MTPSTTEKTVLLIKVITQLNNALKNNRLDLVINQVFVQQTKVTDNVTER